MRSLKYGLILIAISYATFWIAARYIPVRWQAWIFDSPAENEREMTVFDSIEKCDQHFSKLNEKRECFEIIGLHDPAWD